MQLSKPSPAHTCSAVAFVAFILPILSLVFSNSRFVSAEADLVQQGGHNHLRALTSYDQSSLNIYYGWDDDKGTDGHKAQYSSSKPAIVTKDTEVPTTLGNNVPGKDSIQGGQTHYLVFPNETLWGPLSPMTPGIDVLKRREENGVLLSEYMDPRVFSELRRRQSDILSPRQVYITLNICDQPAPNVSIPNGAPPQLQLYFSQSSSNQQPGPESAEQSQSIPVDGGYASATLSATNAIYFGVVAPLSSNFNGSYNYEITASIDDPYTSYRDTDELFVLDSDSNSALLSTNDINNAPQNSSTFQQWFFRKPPFSIFVHNQNDSTILGMHRSFCGLKNHAQIVGNIIDPSIGSVNVSMITTAAGSPEQQFHVHGLNRSSAYYAFLAIDGNSSQAGGGVVGGGGTVWNVTNFSTKSDGNCQVIYNLSFCSDVAYAVPSNPNFTDLTSFYDDNARELYQNFNYSLQQIPCNTTSSAQYSLARNCTSCAAAYKRWLCAVTIPRCDDLSTVASFLQPRNIAQSFINNTDPLSSYTDRIFTAENLNTSYMASSRNVLIDERVKPGPYNEVLPCKEMCYDLVQSCPASLGFACPLPGKGSNKSYGFGNSHPGAPITCNYPGAKLRTNTATRGTSLLYSMFTITVVIGVHFLV